MMKARRNMKNAELIYLFNIYFIGMSCFSSLLYLKKISSTCDSMLSHPDDTFQETDVRNVEVYKIWMIAFSQIYRTFCL